MAEKERVTVDFFTVDEANDEFVLYLVEEGPWSQETLEQRMRAIQARVYGAVDVAIDGHLAKAHPNSRGSRVRVQVDLHGKAPSAVEALVQRLAEHITSAHEYASDIRASEYIKGLRIVAKQL
jgi:calcineurin-like phosphoesterase family protein